MSRIHFCVVRVLKATAPVLVLASLSWGCRPELRPPPPTTTPGVVRETMNTFSLESSAFAAGGPIPTEFTCDGSDRSPDLRWGEPPANTASFALIVGDPDAPRGEFTHWLLFDIPSGTRTLAAGSPSLGSAGKNDFGKAGYGGPCPPHGHGRHHYVFTLYALDVEHLGLRSGARRADVDRALQGHVVGQARLIGTYERR